jgi:branched-chain amino acid transport system substrate-binding protein
MVQTTITMMTGARAPRCDMAWRLFALVAMVALAAALPAAAAAAPEKVEDGEIRIGEFGSLTGSEATFGQDTKAGIDLAIKEANDGGGVTVAGGPKRKLRVIVYDDQGKTEEVTAVVTKLIQQDKVHVLLGEVASTLSLTGAPLAQKYKIPMVTPSSTNPKVTEVGDFIFRVCFIDPFQGTVMAKFAKNTLEAKTAGVFIDNGSDYAVGLAKYFSETFKKLGGEIVSEQAYQKTDMDFKAQLTGFREKNPDVLFVPGYYTQVGQIALQAKDLGLNSILLGGDGWDSPKLAEIGGQAIEGAYFSNHYHPKETRPEVGRFVEAYKKAYSVVPNGLSALGYDAARLVIDAMGRARSLKGEDLRDAIKASKDFPGVTGKITINKERNADKSAVVLEVRKDGFEYKEKIDP